MKRLRVLLLAVLSVLPLVAQAETSLFRVISYNVENFFDPARDSLKRDQDFTPEGKFHWTISHMHRKAEQIAKVIACAGGWGTPALIGLCEVENRHCMNVLCEKLKSYPYHILHFESPDERGIDVALLYDPYQFKLIDFAAISVPLGEDKTRDILYAQGVTRTKDTLHVFMVHLPSMAGGAKTSEWKRQAGKDQIRHKTDSILARHPQAQIIVMGDMNCSAQDDIAGLHNKMLKMEKKGLGTEKYHGVWACLDQIYLSDALNEVSEVQIFAPSWLQERDERYAGLKPKRTYIGYKYQRNGYSDHLPVVLDIRHN